MENKDTRNRYLNGSMSAKIANTDSTCAMSINDRISKVQNFSRRYRDIESDQNEDISDK